MAKSVYAGALTNPQSVSFLRMALSVPELFIVCGIVLRQRMFRINLSDVPLMALAGSLVAIYQVFYFSAIPLVGVAVATLVALCSAPVIAAILSAFILRKLPSRTVLIALLLALAGTMLLIRIDALQSDTQTTTGILFSVTSGGLYAINTLVGQGLGKRSTTHPLQTTLFGFSAGACVLFIVALALPGAGAGLVLNYTMSGWLGLLYLGFFPTAVAHVLFYAGMRHTTAGAASIASLLEPLTATFLAVIIFGEQLAPLTLMGGAMLILAMLLLLRAR